MLSKKNLDELSGPSREFYERALMKMSLSLVFAAIGFVFLGFASQAGGLSSSSNYQLKIDGLSGKNFCIISLFFKYCYDNSAFIKIDDEKDGLKSKASGYGFACFAYILGFIIASAVSIYISPLLIGSANEKKMLSNPQEIDSSSSGNIASPVVATPIGGQPEPPNYSGYPDERQKNI
jgi:hypothetical protein